MVSPSVSSAGLMYLGSFTNPPNGQDDDLAVLAAILAATGVDYSATLESIYKNDQPGDSGIAKDYFETSYDPDEKHSGEIKEKESGDLSSIGYEALFVTAKIGSLGFNLYEWVQDNGDYKFYDAFYLGPLDEGPATYEYGTWANSGVLADRKDVSHVSIWGAPTTVEPPIGGPGALPEPASLLVWSLIGVLGIGWRLRGQVKA